MNKRVRQYVGLLSAVFGYYVIHEGAHLVYALSTGAFRQINFMGMGIQIGIYEERMDNTQFGIFCGGWCCSNDDCGLCVDFDSH